jgi:glycosyltransferase involved in cell wall biosynthesis
MRVLILNNARASADKPKRGSYVTGIGDCIRAAGFDVAYLLPRQPGRSAAGKLWSYLQFYWDILGYDLSRHDLLYVNHYPFLALPLLLRVGSIDKLVVHWHGEDLVPPSRLRAVVFSAFIRLLPGWTHHFVPSRYFRNLLLERIPEARITVSPSGGVKLDRFSVKRSAGRDDRVRIGFASGLDQHKGLSELNWLISNLDRLEASTGKKSEIHYIDYGPSQGSLRSDSRPPLSALVRWDPRPNSEMPEFFHAIDVLLFPSRRKAESLGLVPLEAMACGVPVIAGNSHACPEYVVSGRSGELFDPGNPEDMMEKLTTCIGRLRSYRPRDVIEAAYSFRVVSRQYAERLPEIEGKASRAG